MGKKIRAWDKDFDAIDTIPEDAAGFERELYERTLEQDIAWMKSGRSTPWARKRVKRHDPEEVVHDMLSLKVAVENLIRIHGVPKGTTVELALCGHLGKGLSGFEDVEGARSKPYILLDKAMYLECTPEEVMDVYCGIGIHEASHLNHTRKLYDRLVSKTLCQEQAIWEGLIEDERIEQLAREESPGFGAYLMSTKRVLFEDKEFGAAIGAWRSSVDKDKIKAIIFGFLRCPHVLMLEQKEWKTLSGVPVYQTLRDMFKHMPRTEDDVAAMSQVLWTFIQKLYADYEELMTTPVKDIAKKLMEEGIGGTGGGTGGEDTKGEPSKKLLNEIGERLIRQEKADADDKVMAEKLDDLKKTLKDMVEDHAKETSDLAGVTEAVTDGSGIKTLESVDAAKARVDKEAKKRKADRASKSRFGLEELIAMLSRGEKVTETLSSKETVSAAKAEEDRLEFGDEWEHKEHSYGHSSSGAMDRKVLVVHPKPDASMVAAYKTAHDLVRDSVASMRAALRVRMGQREHIVTELMEGQLHRRMLSKINHTDRVFKSSYIKKDVGLSIGLLLDESGSMGYASNKNSRAGKVLQIAVCIAEALKRVPGIELEVYSHSSCGREHRDCLVKYLYGRKQPDVTSIAGYHNGYENYDHMAIRTATKLLMENTTNPKRVLLVLSDGTPAGRDYGGSKATQKVREEVAKAEKLGVFVLSIGITNFDVSNMFKHSIQFLDLATLSNKMRGLIMSMVKSVT